jgi:hypothetical protein
MVRYTSPERQDAVLPRWRLGLVWRLILNAQQPLSRLMLSAETVCVFARHAPVCLVGVGTGQARDFGNPVRVTEAPAFPPCPHVEQNHLGAAADRERLPAGMEGQAGDRAVRRQADHEPAPFQVEDIDRPVEPPDGEVPGVGGERLGEA